VFGQVGLLLALVGILFAVGGAAIENVLLRAYNTAAVLRLALGKEGAAGRGLALHARLGHHLRARLPGRHDRVRPVKLTEYSVIFSVVALPLTYLRFC